MLVLAIFFPIHYFFIGHVVLGLFYWVLGPAIVTVFGFLTLGFGFLLFLAWPVAWIIGMITARPWTDEYNHRRSAEYATAMDAWNRAQHPPSSLPPLPPTPMP